MSEHDEYLLDEDGQPYPSMYAAPLGYGRE